MLAEERPDVRREVLSHLEGERGLATLVDEVSEDLGVPRYVVSREVYRLEEEGEVSLADPSPPVSLTRYISSHYSHWLRLSLAAVAATLLAVYAFPQSPPYVYLRWAFGSLFVLFLPGFSLVEALFPKEEDLDGVERLALSLGLSLALVPLVGLVLNYTPWGIRLDPIVASLTLLTVFLVVVAAVRKTSYLRLSSHAEPASSG